MNLPKGRAAMATLVATEGSSPRSTGSRMWVDEAGRIVGSVTIGGCVDARVIEASTRALENGEPALLTMALGDEDAWAIGMTCAGTIEVLVEPVDPADPVARALGVASDEVQAGRTVVIVAYVVWSAEAARGTGGWWHGRGRSAMLRWTTRRRVKPPACSRRALRVFVPSGASGSTSSVMRHRSRSSSSVRRTWPCRSSRWAGSWGFARW
jgi:xanthine/CO dehydrogenase XdhC/CoxF family maturation factor